MNFQNPEIRVNKINVSETETVEIKCHEINDAVREVVSFVKSRQGQLEGIHEGSRFEIPVTDIVYIEAVDNRTFIYTAKESYESRQKLYELEEMLKQRRFIRISKSTILNLMKVKAIKPAVSGRFSALLTNGEEVIISRKYVSDLKKTLKGDRE